MKKFIFTFAVLLIVQCYIKVDNCMCQWVQTVGISGMNYISVLKSSGSVVYAGAGIDLIWKTTNNGTNWFLSSSGLPASTMITDILASGSTLYATTSGNGVYRSLNSGTSWVRKDSGMTNWNVEAVTTDGSRIYTGTGHGSTNGGVFFTSNSGEFWYSLGFPNSVTHWVNTLEFINGSLYVGTGSAGGGGIFKHNGTAWFSAGLGGNEVNSIKTNTAASAYFAGTNTGVYVTYDGVIWNPVNNGLTNTYVYCLLYYNGNLFAGTEGGVFMSSNNGANWINKNQGLGNNRWVYCLAATNNYIFCGTNGYGVYRRLYSDIISSVEKTSNSVPEKYSLSQNYPNPFNPTTKIRFYVPSTWSSPHGLGGDLITLSVFDITGREVQTLVNEILSPGTYFVDWNASEFASGVYFYRLQAGSFTETKRMTLIK